MSENEQQEIGGAQVLVQLSTKNQDRNVSETDPESKKIQQKEEEESKQVAENDSVTHDDEETKTNQQINDAVEAAVMKYVGGNLENDNRRGKKRSHSDEIIPEFQGWTGFLEENMDGQQNEEGGNNDGIYGSGQNGSRNNEQSGEQSGEASDLTTSGQAPSSKRKKGDLDADLSDLDDNSEHDRLVREAIMETRELARQLSSFPGLNTLPAHQQHQVIVALQNNIIGNNAAVSNITHNRRNSKALRDRIKSHISSLPEPEHHHNEHAVGEDALPISGRKDFTNVNTLDRLSQDAQKLALAWFKDQPEMKGPRPFAPEEKEAVDHFIEGYCHLNKTDRKGVCNRIWTTARIKDNFWESLTRVLPYRSRASIYKHVRRQYHVFDVRGKWTPEDDDKLRTLAQSKPGNWKEIGAELGRMSEDCRDRWRNYIKCGTNRLESKWTPEEEEQLKIVVEEMNEKSGGGAINWTLVSERLNGTRSRIQCRYKWNKLVKRDSVARVSYLDDESKLWLFEQLKSMNYENQKDIDWDTVTKLYNEKYPGNQTLTDTDFKFGFDKLRGVIREHRMYVFPHLIDQLVRETKRVIEEKSQMPANW